MAAVLWAHSAAGQAAAPVSEAGLHGPAWLDEAHGRRALRWVAAQNRQTLNELRADPQFERLRAGAAAVLTDPGRIPEARIMAGAAYEYRQDRDRPLGVWRRTDTRAYFAGAPVWETVLDLDQLSKAEGRQWLFAGAACQERRCLVRLSDKGKDAGVTREFDLDAKAFVQGGFLIPESKARAWWYDRDTLLVAPVLEADSVNESGLPRTVRLWRRGTPLRSAKTLFTGERSDAGLSVSLIRAAGVEGFVVARHPDFFRREYSLVRLDGTRRPLALPPLAEMLGVHEGRLLMRLNAPWGAANQPPLPAGVVAAAPLEPLLRERRIGTLEAIYQPAEGEAVRGAASAPGKLYLELLRNYRSAIVEAAPSPAGEWRARTVPLAADGFVSLLGLEQGRLFLKAESPISPEKLLLADPVTGEARVLYARPPAFDPTGLTMQLFEARSRDGTRVAYTVVHRGVLKLDGRNPTLVYGYGGFDVAVTPRYEPIFGKLWVEPGGVYVHAYIRGGGERGPDWHRGAQGVNRQQPYDDMIAVLQDLHARKVASPTTTGIMGRSNGGLMTAVVMEQRPDLMNAVVTGGPLIDMLNYHALPPGASWIAEYGDPRDPKMRGVLATYSPMQKLAKAGPYPPPLIITSTDDDRVAPGHARRFSARMSALGHKNYYFEDRQGGHYWELAGGPGPGDWRLRSVARAVEFTYLWRRLRE
ncbi:MAG: prolyl oligopeptidase family serine peptidase [Proteobacteria bacterium]|nr:prolyl oligopeptidase family serine peptidase [Pseudomonadota bacterium]